MRQLEFFIHIGLPEKVKAQRAQRGLGVGNGRGLKRTYFLKKPWSY